MSPRPSMLKSAPEGGFRIARPLTPKNGKGPIGVPKPVTRSILYNSVGPPGPKRVNKASPEPDGTGNPEANVSTPGGMSKLAVKKSTPTGPTANWTLNESKVYSVVTPPLFVSLLV